MQLADRYPDIHFLLRINRTQKVRLPRRAKQIEKWLQSQDLEQIEILYLVGLIDYPLPETLKQWLGEKPERAIVFIESRLGAFASFRGEGIFSNPQIHCFYAEGDCIEELASEFPSEAIAVYDGEPFAVLTLKRRSAAYSALYSDVLYSQKIVGNVLKNVGRLSSCFDATGPLNQVPLVICGAGPSLEGAIPILKKYPNRALILAVGSGVAALTRQGVIPHLSLALDPNDEEFHNLAQGTYFEGPFLFSPRLHSDVFATSNGPFGYLRSDSGGFIESFIEEELDLKQIKVGPDLGSEAFSVTTLALSWASSQGFSDVLLTGIDLAYSSGKRYAGGLVGNASVSQTLDQVIERPDLHGNPCQTLVKWVMESDVIAAFAKQHPEIRFINSSLAGLGFEGIPNRSLEDELSQFPQRDIGGLVHRYVHAKEVAFDEDAYQTLLSELAESLERCKSYCDELLKEPNKGKRILLVSDLHEEKAYHAFLEGIDHTLDHLLCRYIPHLNPEAVRKERDEAKYQEIRRQILLFEKILARVLKICL